MMPSFQMYVWYGFCCIEQQDDHLSPTEVTAMAAKMTGPGAGAHMPSATASASEQSIRELSNVFKLLSDETRLRILTYLAQNNELHVSDLCDRLGQSQPAVSHHLALLRVSGLIEPRREGKHNFYSVRTDAFGELLARLLSASGELPKKMRFHDFTLSHQGR
jgi:ArsR family transcriptional regulator